MHTLCFKFLPRLVITAVIASIFTIPQIEAAAADDGGGPPPKAPKAGDKRGRDDDDEGKKPAKPAKPAKKASKWGGAPAGGGYGPILSLFANQGVGKGTPVAAFVDKKGTQRPISIAALGGAEWRWPGASSAHDAVSWGVSDGGDGIRNDHPHATIGGTTQTNRQIKFHITMGPGVAVYYTWDLGSGRLSEDVAKNPGIPAPMKAQTKQIAEQFIAAIKPR